MTPATFRQWIAALGGRRFLLTLGSGMTTSLLVLAGKITDPTYATVVLGTVGVYIGGNVMQKRSAKSKEEADA